MMRTVQTILVTTLLLGLSAQAASRSDNLMDQGKWAAAADAAVAEKDYNTAARAMHRLQECPAPDQPSGQNWNYKIAGQGVAYARQALAANPTGRGSFEAQMNLGNLLGNQASALIAGPSGLSNMKETISVARESKAAYEQALKLSPNDPWALGTMGIFHARGYNNGGMIIGAKLADAKYLTMRAAQLFNQMPDQTKDQQTMKAWAAHRIGVSFESMNDKNKNAFFEAAIKLGEQAGGAEGKCAANVARVHMGRPASF